MFWCGGERQNVYDFVYLRVCLGGGVNVSEVSKDS